MILSGSAHTAGAIKDLRRVSFTGAVLDSRELLHQRLAQIVNKSGVSAVDIIRDLKKTPRGVILPRLNWPLRKTLWRRRLYLRQHTHVIVVLRNGRVAISVGNTGRIGEGIGAV